MKLSEGDLTITCRECDEDTVVDSCAFMYDYAKCDECEKELNPDWYNIELVFALLKRIEKLEKAE